MTDPLCFCGAPVPDQAYACNTCTHGLERALGEVPALAEQLDLAITRQTKLAAGTFTGQRRAEPSSDDIEAAGYRHAAETLRLIKQPGAAVQPLTYDAAASDAATVLRSTLVGWVRVVVEERGSRWPADTLAAMGTMLLGQVGWLRHHAAAAEAFDELIHAIGFAWRAVDRRPDLLYAGPCDPSGDAHAADGVDVPGPCPTDLYAAPGRSTVTCPRCQLVWDVEARRDYLLEAARDQLATAAELSRFLTVYGEPVKGDRVRKWAERGLIAAHGHDSQRRPLYRIGEAIDLLVTMERKSA